jgi:hypothetical protein
LVRPVIVQLVPVDVQVPPPGLAVAVYPVTGEPPVAAGAVHEAASWVFPGVSVTPVGAPGALPQGPEEVVAVAEVQEPTRAFTCGVIPAPVARSTVEPATLLASVVVPSPTSYRRPAGGFAVADAVQLTRQVDASRRVALTVAGT